jgi:hypothetical protein
MKPITLLPPPRVPSGDGPKSTCIPNMVFPYFLGVAHHGRNQFHGAHGYLGSRRVFGASGAGVGSVFGRRGQFGPGHGAGDGRTGTGTGTGIGMGVGIGIGTGIGYG